MSVTNNIGRSRRPFCYHKRGISLDDTLSANVADADDTLRPNEESPPESRDHTMSCDDVTDHVTDDEALDDCQSLRTRFGLLLSCEDMADVHFVVGGAKGGRQLRIPAHRLVLAVGSPVFKDMFYAPPTQEADPNADIVLADIEPVVFLEFLRYLYTDTINLNKDNSIPVLHSAKQYEIPRLESACVRFLTASIGAANCLAIWLSAKTCGEAEFEALALRVIQRFAREVCSGADFLRADLSSVCQLLADDRLRISEVHLFQAVTRWAKSQCLRNGLCPTRVHLRQVLAEAIDLIRFPLMTEDQIRRTVANEGVLEEEVVRTLLCSHRTWPRVAKPVQFCNRPRAHQRLLGPLLTVQRFQSFDNQLSNRFSNKSLHFSVNKPIFVAGVGLYGPRKACTFFLQIALSIVRTDCGACASVVDRTDKVVRVKCDGSQPVLNVTLDAPFAVEANSQYEITAKITATDKPTGSVVRARLNPHLFYTCGHQINFYYGTGGQFAAKVRTADTENVIFNFSWDSIFDDTISDISVIPASSSAPPTPNPPPRPPPPKEYRRPSRLARIRRALSFADKNEPKTEDRSEVMSGQIPVIMFFA